MNGQNTCLPTSAGNWLKLTSFMVYILYFVSEVNQQYSSLLCRSGITPKIPAYQPLLKD